MEESKITQPMNDNLIPEVNAADILVRGEQKTWESQIKEGEALLNNLIAKEKTGEGVNLLEPAISQTPTPPAPTSPVQTVPVVANAIPAPQQGVETKQEVPQQFRKEDGSLDESKLLESHRNLEEANKKKVENLVTIETYKKLHREFTQNAQKLAEEVKSVQSQPTPQNPPTAQGGANPFEQFPDETQKMFAIADFVAQQRAGQVLKENQTLRLDIALAETLNGRPELLEANNFKKINDTLKEKSYFWNSENPYEDVAHYLFGERGKRSLAITQPTTPIQKPVLGAGRGVPPPIIPKGASDEQRLVQLASEIKVNVTANTAIAKQQLEEYYKLMEKQLLVSK